MKIEKYFDRTILKPKAKKNEENILCMEAIQYGLASVCVKKINRVEI